MGNRHAKLIRARIQTGLDDAAAHAFRALTQVLKDATEGRPTIAAVRQSRFYLAAISRLNELHDALVPMFTEARTEFYIVAYRDWWAITPPETRRFNTGVVPQTYITAYVNSILHGLTVTDTVWKPVRNAQEQLEQTLTIAGSRATPDRQAEGLVKAWEDRASNTISQVCQTLVQDSVYRALYVAGRDVHKAELLEPDPSLGE